MINEHCCCSNLHLLSVRNYIFIVCLSPSVCLGLNLVVPQLSPSIKWPFWSFGKTENIQPHNRLSRLNFLGPGCLATRKNSVNSLKIAINFSFRGPWLWYFPVNVNTIGTWWCIWCITTRCLRIRSRAVRFGIWRHFMGVRREDHNQSARGPQRIFSFSKFDASVWAPWTTNTRSSCLTPWMQHRKNLVSYCCNNLPKPSDEWGNWVQIV